MVVLLQVKSLIKIIVKFRAELVLCTFASFTKHAFEGRKQRLCSSTLKRNKLKGYISLKGNKLACFANS